MNRNLKHITGTILSLKRNNQFQFALRHAMQIYNSGAIYSFIPKNACSTMRYSLAKVNGFIEDEKDINWIHRNNQVFIPNLESLIIAKYTFVILRCPYSRLASVFLDAFIRQTPDAFQYYELTGRLINPFHLTFRMFVDSLSKASILNSNIHWRPQVDFLIYKTYDDYFAMENFKKIEETLNDKIDFQVCDARRLTNHGLDGLNQIKDNINNSDLPVIDIIKLRNENKTFSPRTLYDDVLFSKVSRIYASDINLYIEKFGDEHLLKI